MKNKELGLPYSEDGMENILVAFDVDGTIVGKDTNDHYASTLRLLHAFCSQKWKNVDIIVWSGGGAKYAEVLMRQHMLPGYLSIPKFHSKMEYTELRKRYDKVIAFDDIQDTRLGDANLIVRNK